MIYLDSSALLKLVFDEVESADLGQWLTERRGVPLISSALATVEVVRACRRIDTAAVPVGQILVSQLDLVPVAADVLGAAAELPDPLLRSLDAIHLASALAVREVLTDFVAYDRRLLLAAGRAGLPVLSPGRA